MMRWTTVAAMLTLGCATTAGHAPQSLIEAIEAQLRVVWIDPYGCTDPPDLGLAWTIEECWYGDRDVGHCVAHHEDGLCSEELVRLECDDPWLIVERLCDAASDPKNPDKWRIRQ